jgi:uncharacterized Zn-binding protein involved in type VI secretion
MNRVKQISFILCAALLAGSFVACGPSSSKSDDGAQDDPVPEGDADADPDADPDGAEDVPPEGTDDGEPDVVPPPSCGNNVTEPGEACDGSDLGGFDCASLAPRFTSGALACRADCLGYDVTGCAEDGAVVPAATCSQQDVQAAVDAAADGDTVTVPEGTCTWTTLSAGEPAVLIEGKAITLQGAGIDLTIIDDDTGIGGPESMLVVEGAEGKPFRITGFTMQRVRSLDDTDTFLIAVYGTSRSWRIDHNKFIGAAFGSPDASVHVSGYTYGVVDHCTLEGFGRVTVYGDLWSDALDWTRPLSLGTGNAVFIEDCSFDSLYEGEPIFSNAIDSVGGSRFVFRHNALVDRYVEAHGINWEGARSTFSYEVYDNDFVDGPTAWIAVSVRGGTGVIYDNRATGFVDGNRINIYNDRSCRDDGPEDGICDTGEFTCDGSNPLDGNQVEDSGAHTGTDDASTLVMEGKTWETDVWSHCTIRNETDGSLGTITACTADSVSAELSGGADNDWDAGDAFTISCGYPCLDQIGRSTDASAENPHPQLAEPLYEWNNISDGEDFDIIPHDIGLLHQHHLQEGRDFFNDTPRPGYVPYVYPHPLVQLD